MSVLTQVSSLPRLKSSYCIILCQRNFRLFFGLGCAYHDRREETKSVSSYLTNTMKTRNRAWSVHRAVFDRLRQDILVKPKYLGQVAVSSITKSSLFNTSTQKSPKDQILQELNNSELVLLMEESISISNTDQLLHMKSLELEFCRRLREYSIKEMLYAMDLFYKAEYRAPRYFRECFQMIDLKFDEVDLNTQHVLQLLFYASFYRNCPITLMRSLEEFIVDKTSELSGDEIGLLCHAFFTTNTPFHNYDLIKNISDRTLSAWSTSGLQPYTLSNVLKTLRHAGYESREFYQKLGDIVASQIASQKIPVNSCLALLRTYASVGFTHSLFCSKLLTAIDEKFQSNQQSSIRFKDLICILWGYQTLQHPCSTKVTDALLQLMEEEFNQISRDYPEQFVEGLMVLALSDCYPQNALSHALSPKFLEMKKDLPLEQHFQVLFLDTVVQLKCHNYTGNKLKKNYLDYIPREVFCNISKELEFRQGLSTVLAGLQRELGGSEYVKCHNVLRYSKLPDLEMRLDGQNNPIKVVTPEDDVLEVTTKCREEGIPISVIDSLTDGKGNYAVDRLEPTSLHLKPRAEVKKGRKLIVKVLGWHQYTMNSSTLLGLHRYELEMLQENGYEIITVNPLQASKIENMTISEQQEFIRQDILGVFGISCRS